ncbi:hypothetical protein AB8O53_26435, partial [Streptomyces pilosus]
RPAPPPPPPPAPPPPDPPKPRPSAAPVHYPAYRAAPARKPGNSTTSPLTFVLLITTPAVVAIAALRPR